MVRRLYQGRTEPIIFNANGQIPETVTESRWHQPWSEPVKVLQNPRATIALIASGMAAFVLNPNTQITQTFESRWHQAWSEPSVKTKAGLPTGEQTTLAFTPLVTTTTVDGAVSVVSLGIPNSVYNFQYQSRAYTPFTPATVNFNDWTNWDDIVFKRALVRDPSPWQFVANPAQVFYPFDRWPDTAPAAKRTVEFPYLAFVAPQAPWTQWTRWPSFAAKAKLPTSDFPTTVLGSPPPQVWYPPDRWPDSAPAAKRVAQQQDLAYGTFVTPAFIPTWAAWTNWPDFLLRAKSVPDFKPWSFVPPPVQVFFPFDRWADTAPAAKRAAEYPTFTFPYQTPSQVWFPWDRWPDTAPGARRAIFQDQSSSPFVPPAVVLATYAFLNWTDPVQIRIPWTTGDNSIQFVSVRDALVFSPYDRWPDINYKKPQPLDTQPLIWGLFTPTPTVTDFSWPGWPDFTPGPKRVTDFMPWRFIPSPAQVFFPYAPWDDFARRKQAPLIYPPLTFTPIHVPLEGYIQWPDLVRSKQPPLIYTPLTFVAKHIPLEGYIQWPDFATKKKPPLNYDPLALVQTVRTPWTPYTVWPDFVPIRRLPGLLPPYQMFTARYPGIITQAPVTVTMQALEINGDVAIFAINIVPYTTITTNTNAAAKALVSIKEIGRFI